MLKIAKKYNIDDVDKAIDACEFVERYGNRNDIK